jgi:hypothetical protein
MAAFIVNGGAHPGRSDPTTGAHIHFEPTLRLTPPAATIVESADA